MIFTGVLKNAFLITGLVMVMMLLIEYFNVHSQGRPFRKIERSRFGQVLLGALLGLVPGCIGGFALVSLFTHRIVSFGALVAMMIAATGDEAFVLFAMIPKTALLLNVILFALALVVGLIVDRVVKRFPAPFSQRHFAIHEHRDDVHSDVPFFKRLLCNLRRLTFQRALLLFGLLVFILGMAFGVFEHDHVHVDSMHHHHDFLFSERWLNLLFAGLGVVVLALIAAVNEHFLEAHLWGHLIRKHFLKIFVWTFGALLLIQYGLQYFDVQHWISENPMPVLFAAVLIGIIPESGPHIMFITLFASGHIPFSVLLANSVVQDGHTALPLLAESKRGFLWSKLVNVAVGLIAGLTGYLCGF
ncbi:MAG: putative manganese transporter [Prevotellaceae bacterium]|jgi:hypothetical protein|nr:putative manganese transporter [Prevotellaceae bacterium]